MATQQFYVGDGHVSPAATHTDLEDFASNKWQGTDFLGDDVVVWISGLADHSSVADFYNATNANSLTIKPLAGEEANGVAGGSSTNAVIQATAAGGYIWFSADCEKTIQDLELDGNGQSFSAGFIRDGSTGTGGTYNVLRCVIHDTAGTWTSRGIHSQETTATWVVRNSIFDSIQGSGFGCDTSVNGTYTVEGCAFYNCNKVNDGDSGGIDFYQRTSTSTITVRNCIALGNTREDFADTTIYDTFTNSMSSDPTAGTANNNHQNKSDTSIWTSPSTGDFTLKASTNAVDGGATIAALTPDIAGTVRPQGSAYDMGPFEIAAADTQEVRTQMRMGW